MKPLTDVAAKDLPLADRLRRLPGPIRRALYKRLGEELGPQALASLRWEWERFFARPDQLVPRDHDWVLIVFAGPRGDGKTEAALHLWLREILEGRSTLPRFFCATEDDVEKLVVRRILPALPPQERPEWKSTDKVLVFRNGVTAQGYAAAATESCVGDEGDLDFIDDPAKFGARGATAWKHARTSCRKGLGRCIVATTRRGVEFIRKILAGEVAEVRRAPRPRMNIYNLVPGYYERMAKELGGDAFYLQEIEDVDVSSSSPFAGLDFAEEPIRCGRPRPDEIDEVVIAIDPSDGKGPTHDDWGIGAACRRKDRHVVALEDRTGNYDEEEAGKAALTLAAEIGATKIVVETNHGRHVTSTLRAAHLKMELDALRGNPHARARPMPEIVLVNAKDKKDIRAGPVRSLYVDKLIHHVAGLFDLEKEMLEWEPRGPRRVNVDNRIDWLVHAAHHLADLGGKAAPERHVDTGYAQINATFREERGIYEPL